MFTLPVIERAEHDLLRQPQPCVGRPSEEQEFLLAFQPQETIDWSRQEEDPTGEYDISTWSPTKTFADYTALNTLPRVDLDVSCPEQRKMARRVRPPLLSTTRHPLWLWLCI